MPPRLNKRQQRELEELEALGGPSKHSGSELTDDEAPIVQNKGVFAAATFIPPDSGSDDSDSESPAKKSKKSKKKKKKTSGGAKTQNDEPTVSTPAPASKSAPGDGFQAELKLSMSASERKALKKAKQKEKKAKEDDLGKVLAELSIQIPTKENLSRVTTKDHRLAELLGVSLRNLDAEAELRKFFGSRVVQATKTGSSSPSRRNAGALRSNLTRPRPTWGSGSLREGLSIRPLTDEEARDMLQRHTWEATDDKWWTVEYSKKYKSVTKAFIRAVMSGDPEGLFELLRRLPWHADTLLQLSEVYRHREEYAQAVDFIDRALFTYERSFIGAFNLTSGRNRLDFDRVENRPFYLAIHRQVVDLQRRGCIRTAFEFARLLLSLDPWSDPHGAYFHLDQVSIKAHMAQWLIDVYDIFNHGYPDPSKNMRLNPTLLPGWAYSHALALHTLEKDDDHTASTASLAEAIKDFPSIVPLLADKLEVSLSPAIRGHPSCKIETGVLGLSRVAGIMHLLSHLYAERSFQLWKDHATWFAETVTSTFASLPSTEFPPTPRNKAFCKLYACSEPLQYSLYRHIIVLESNYRRLLSFIPSHILGERSLACDPFPPKEALTLYNPQFFEGTEDTHAYRPRTRRQREMDQRRLAQMIPDAAFRQQLEAFFEAQGLERMFPGGIVEFAHAAAQLPPRELEDMMMNGMLALGEDQGVEGHEFPRAGRRMPGQMPMEDMLAVFGVDGPQPGPVGENVGAVGEGPEDHVEDNDDDDDDDDDDDEEDEDEEEIAPMPRMIRNILGRLWGRAPPADESSSSEDEDEDEDLNAVD